MRGGRASYEHAPQPGELASSPTELVGVLPGPLTGHQAGETQGHSGEYGNAAKLVGKMSKSVMQLISINF